jgi:hypothetical protein
LKGTPARRAEDFAHFVRKCHPCERAYQEFLPELLATDGTWVRRAASEQRQFVVQEFRAPVIADEIRTHINSERNPGSALMGYSAFERTASVAILHSGEGLEPGWLAMPWQSRLGEPALPALANYVDKTPAMQLVARGQMGGTSRTRLLEVTVEQCGADADLLQDVYFDIIPYVDSLNLWGTYQTSRGFRQVRMSRRGDDDSVSRRTLTRIEKGFAIDQAVYRRVNENEKAGIWLEIEFMPTLFCLPKEWRRWWFEITI